MGCISQCENQSWEQIRLHKAIAPLACMWEGFVLARLGYVTAPIIVQESQNQCGIS